MTATLRLEVAAVITVGIKEARKNPRFVVTYSGKGNSTGTNRTQAAGADIDCLVLTVDNNLNGSDVRFPSSVGLSVGMGNIMTKGNTLFTDAAFCHVRHLLRRSAARRKYDC